VVIHDQGVGVLIVEQSPELIAGLVNRVYLLEQGRIVAAGTVEEIGGSRAIARPIFGRSPRGPEATVVESRCAVTTTNRPHTSAHPRRAARPKRAPPRRRRWRPMPVMGGRQSIHQTELEER